MSWMPFLAVFSGKHEEWWKAVGRFLSQNERHFPLRPSSCEGTIVTAFRSRFSLPERLNSRRTWGEMLLQQIPTKKAFRLIPSCKVDLITRYKRPTNEGQTPFFSWKDAIKYCLSFCFSNEGWNYASTKIPWAKQREWNRRGPPDVVNNIRMYNFLWDWLELCGEKTNASER